MPLDEETKDHKPEIKWKQTENKTQENIISARAQPQKTDFKSNVQRQINTEINKSNTNM